MPNSTIAYILKYYRDKNADKILFENTTIIDKINSEAMATMRENNNMKHYSKQNKNALGLRNLAQSVEQVSKTQANSPRFMGDHHQVILTKKRNIQSIQSTKQSDKHPTTQRESDNYSLSDFDDRSYIGYSNSFANVHPRNVDPSLKVLQNASKMALNNQILKQYIQQVKYQQQQQSAQKTPNSVAEQDDINLEPQYDKIREVLGDATKASKRPQRYGSQESITLPYIKSSQGLQIVNLKNQVIQFLDDDKEQGQEKKPKESKVVQRKKKEQENNKQQMEEELINNHVKKLRSLNESKSCINLNREKGINAGEKQSDNIGLIQKHLEIKRDAVQMIFNPLSVNKLTGIHQKQDQGSVSANKSPQLQTFLKRNTQQRLYKGASLCGLLSKAYKPHTQAEQSPDQLEPQPSKRKNDFLSVEGKNDDKSVIQVQRLTDEQAQSIDFSKLQITKSIQIQEKPVRHKLVLKTARPSRVSNRSVINSQDKSFAPLEQSQIQTIGQKIDHFFELKKKVLPRLIPPKQIDECQKLNNSVSKQQQPEVKDKAPQKQQQQPQSAFKEKLISQVKQQQQQKQKSLSSPSKLKDMQIIERNKDLDSIAPTYFNKGSDSHQHTSILDLLKNAKKQKQMSAKHNTKAKNSPNERQPKQQHQAYMQIYSDVMELDEKQFNKYPSTFKKNK